MLLSLSGSSPLPPIVDGDRLDSSDVSIAAPESGATTSDGNFAELNDLVQEYCVRCHNERRLRGDLSLQSFDAALPEQNAPVAERMIHKLRAGMMPPAGVRRPPEDSLALLAASLEARLDEVARASPNPGRRTFQRLNRAEYEASILDLFGIHIDASAFLPTEND